MLVKIEPMNFFEFEIVYEQEHERGFYSDIFTCLWIYLAKPSLMELLE